ncbi:hypothetical protein D3C87_831160 [compost metagenome]
MIVEFKILILLWEWSFLVANREHSFLVKVFFLSLEQVQEDNSNRNFLNEIDYFLTVSGEC